MSHIKLYPRPSERKFMYSESVQEVIVPEPLPRPPRSSMPLIKKAMLIGIPLLMVSMMIVMFASGMRSNIMYMAMSAMMMVSMLGSTFINSESGGDDLDEQRRAHSMSLNQQREIAHVNNAIHHDTATLNFPNPRSLPTLMRTQHPSMWTVTPLEPGQRPESSAADPSMVANPYLLARVGTGLALSGTPVRSSAETTLIPEQLEEVTNYSHTSFLSIHNLVPSCPLAIPLTMPALGFRGDAHRIDHTIRTMLLNLSYTHSPRILHIGVVTDNPEKYDWLKWLPHTINITDPSHETHFSWVSMREACQDISGIQDYLSAANAHLIVVVDTPTVAATVPADITGGIVVTDNARAMEHVTFLAAHTADDKALTTPRQRVNISDKGILSVPGDLHMATVDTVEPHEAEDIAREIGHYRPEGFGDMPSGTDDVEISAEAPTIIEAVAGRGRDLESFSFRKLWKKTDKEVSFKVPIALEMNSANNPTGRVAELDITQINSGGNGPHGMFSGLTGTGKSYLLIGIVAMLCAFNSPRKLRIIAADFKGASTFRVLQFLPHFAAVISNLQSSADLVDRFVDAVEGEKQRRDEIFNHYGVGDIWGYRELQKTAPDMEDLPDVLVVMDELRVYVEKHREFVAVLNNWGAVFRSYGFHLFVGSQYLDQSVIGDFEQHAHFGISLKLSNVSHSNTVIRSADAVNLPPARVAILYRNTREKALHARISSFVHSAPYELVQSSATVIDHLDDDSPSADYTGASRPFALTNFAARTESESKELAAPRDIKTTGETQLEALVRRIIDEGKDYAEVRELWAAPLSAPMTMNQVPSHEWAQDRLRVRLGDIDVPQNHARVPFYADFSDPSRASVFVQGQAGSGTSTTLKTLVASAATSFTGDMLSFFIYDYGGAGLSPLEGMPNVSLYANKRNADSWLRMRGEINRILDIREAAFGDHSYTGMEEYLARRGGDGVTGDPYGYIVFMVDSIDAWFTDRYNEGDFPSIEAMEKWPLMSQYGIFFVSSASSTPTGKFRGTMDKVGQHIRHYIPQITDYIKPPSRDMMGQIPPTQPGRILTDSLTDVMGKPVWRHGIIMAPINRTIEPTGESQGVPVYSLHNKTYREEIEELARGLSSPARISESQRAIRVEPVPRNVAFSQVWEAYQATGAITAPARARSVPLGINCATGMLELAAPEHLMVVGDSGSGMTTTLISHMNAVANAHSPKEVRTIVIDPGGGLYKAAKRLIDRGFMQPTSYTNGNEDDLNRLIGSLRSLITAHEPTNDHLDNKEERPWYTGPEIYVYIDRAHQILKGYASEGSLEGLVKLLTTGFDRGVRFIFGMSTTGAEQAVASNPFVSGLFNNSTPVLMLSTTGMMGKLGEHRYAKMPPGRGKLVRNGASGSRVIQIPNSA